MEHHFFPLLVSNDLSSNDNKNHWVMIHLCKKKGKWLTEFYSGIPNYWRAVKKQWMAIAEKLSALSNGELNVTNRDYLEPANQPRQSNSNDCGVLILCEARWIMESFPLETLRSSDCSWLRQSMIVELDRWHLN